MPVNFAFHPNTIMREMPAATVESFSAVCKTIEAMGWQGVEYSAGSAEKMWPDPADYRRAVEDGGLRPLTLYTPYGVCEPDAVPEALERARRSFAYLAAAGCEFALLDGGPHKEGSDRDEETTVLADCADRLGDLAKAAGLRGVWHQHYGTVIEFPPQFHRFMELVDPGLVEFCPDTAQLALGGIDCEDAFRRYLDRITYVHFKDLDSERRMRETGGGVIEFEPLRDLLVGAGYSGWISPDLDYCTGMNAEEAARRCLAKLKELFPSRPGDRDARG